ncbi:MAG: hypothetical protein Q8Q95_03455 [bacterium]|nr:hypothetical protein [bacterium]
MKHPPKIAKPSLKLGKQFPFCWQTAISPWARPIVLAKIILSQKENPPALLAGEKGTR